ncbi:MAG: site-specific DNA-methyltransferase [Chitinispirillales bacterium]|jgi:adenine-specific DNA-methyltransferase|nr:site-specific DNA-methyltransferase [Chitinispirillales bacterium]
MPILDWLGKDKVVNHHRQVPYRALEPQYTYGDANGATGGNMLIHGDNLDALKTLLPRFEGRIKCVYIDPPYNTGNEKWVYNDNVNDPKIKKWLGEVVGREGEDLSRHDKWLCMMYPRLKLMQKLLADDGGIFISIDDNEQACLKLICDEIFGGNNFICKFCVKRVGGRQDSKYFAVIQDYVLCYAKYASLFVAGNDIKETGNYPKYDSEKQRYYKTQLLRKWGANSRREDRPNLYYPITAPDGSKVYPLLSGEVNQRPKIDKILGRWRWSASTMEKALDEGRVEFIKQDDDSFIPYEKIYAPAEGESETKKYTTWIDNTSTGTKVIKAIFGETVFDYPKSLDLLEIICQMGNVKNGDIILDSFAGSATTAHAVLNLNRQDSGNRRFILIEMEDYADAITAERVKRVIDGYGGNSGNGGNDGNGGSAVAGTGGGFTYYELGERLLLEDGNLNESLGEEKIREYVWYTETRTDYAPQSERYLLGVHSGTAYYFYYERRLVTVLGHDFLHSVKTKAGGYLIYADVNELSAEEMDAANIRFKKIPRDIARL